VSRRTGVSRQIIIALILGVAASAGCREEIQSGPSGADVVAERARVKAGIKPSRSGGRSPSGTAHAASSAAVEDAGFAPVSEEYRYRPEGRRDPFQPYRIEATTAGKAGGPLERFELEQLSVVALVWDGEPARAMVADPSGTTYTVGVGSRMGKNIGKVVHIGDNLVLVKETYVDYAGEESTKDVELRIRRSEGG